MKPSSKRPPRNRSRDIRAWLTAIGTVAAPLVALLALCLSAPVGK